MLPDPPRGKYIPQIECAFSEPGVAFLHCPRGKSISKCCLKGGGGRINCNQRVKSVGWDATPENLSHQSRPNRPPLNFYSFEREAEVAPGCGWNVRMEPNKAEISPHHWRLHAEFRHHRCSTWTESPVFLTCHEFAWNKKIVFFVSFGFWTVWMKLFWQKTTFKLS